MSAAKNIGFDPKQAKSEMEALKLDGAAIELSMAIMQAYHPRDTLAIAAGAFIRICAGVLDAQQQDRFLAEVTFQINESRKDFQQFREKRLEHLEAQGHG
jgi:hypothetical protein